HPDLVERRVDLGGRRVEAELALLYLLHRGGAGQRLGHRGDPDHRVERHRRVLIERALAEGAFVDRPARRRRHGDDAWDVTRVHAALQHFICTLFEVWTSKGDPALLGCGSRDQGGAGLQKFPTIDSHCSSVLLLMTELAFDAQRRTLTLSLLLNKSGERPIGQSM